MQIFLLWLLQSAAAPIAPDAMADLAHAPVLPRDACAVARTADTEDIVVCGNMRADRYRLPRLDHAGFETDRETPKAEIGIAGGLKGAAEVESATLLGGQVSNRLMVRLKLPF